MLTDSHLHPIEIVSKPVRKSLPLYNICTNHAGSAVALDPISSLGPHHEGQHLRKRFRVPGPLLYHKV